VTIPPPISLISECRRIDFPTKREVVAYLKELASENKITYTLIFTGISFVYSLTNQGLIFGLDLPFTVAGVNYKARRADIIGTGENDFSICHLDDVGRFLAAILKKPEATKNKVIRIAGDTLTANTLVEKFGKKIGEKFQVRYRPAEEVERIAKDGLASGDVGVYFDNAIPLFTGTGVRF